MPFLPVAAREAKAASRAPKTYGGRTAVAAIGLLAALIALALSRGGASQGTDVFRALSLVAYCYCLFGGVLKTADSISEEKRENTLGLLFLTDLKPRDVITGKLFASSATIVLGLLAFMPLLALPALMGGVKSSEIVWMSLALLNVLFFSITVGLLISTVCRQGWVALCLGLGVMLLLGVVLPVFSGGAVGGTLALPGGVSVTTRASGVGELSIISPFNSVATTLMGGSGYEFAVSLAQLHIFAWVNLALTALLLPRLWQETPRSRRGEKWIQRVRSLRFGNAKTRARFRTRLLNRNPLFWLSGREQVSSGGLMAFMMALVTVSVAGEWTGILFGLVALHGALMVRMASAAAHSLAEDRKSGALELLLATSLSVGDLLRGRWMALGRQFFGPMLIVTLWHLFTVLWLAQVEWHSDMYVTIAGAWLAAALAWLAIVWCGMWLGLRARNPIAATWSALAIAVFLPWLVMLGGVGILGVFGLLPDSSVPAMFGPWRRASQTMGFLNLGWMVWGGYSLGAMAWASYRVRKHFREAATDRFSDTQPMDWRPVRRATIGGAAVAAAIVLSIWGWREWEEQEGERELQTALVKYGEFAATAPVPFTPPSSQNLAHWQGLGPINASVNGPGFFTGAGIVTNGGRPGRLLWLQSDLFLIPDKWRRGETAQFVSQKTQPKAYPANVTEILAEFHAAAAKRPYLQFDGKVEDDSGATVGYGVPLLGVADFLTLYAAAQIKYRARPIDEILLALRLANCVSNDTSGLPLHQRMIGNIVQPIYDGVRAQRWTDDDLQRIDGALAGVDAFREFALWRDELMRDLLRSIDTGTGAVLFNGIMYPTGGPALSQRPGRLKKEKAAVIQDAMEALQGVSLKDRVVRLNMAKANRRPGANGLQRYGNWFALIQQSLSDATAAVAILETDVTLVRIGCAIERFRLANGRWPKALEELQPMYLKELPRDVFTGQPLIYRVDKDARGYWLYSVGPNYADDGGAFNSSRNDLDGDWVWRMPK